MAREGHANRGLIDNVERNILRALKTRRITINLFFLIFFGFLFYVVKTRFEAILICLLGIIFLSIRELSTELNLHYGTEDLRGFQRFKQLSRVLNFDLVEYTKASRESEFKKITYLNEANIMYRLNFYFDIVFLALLIGNIFRFG